MKQYENRAVFSFENHVFFRSSRNLYLPLLSIKIITQYSSRKNTINSEKLLQVVLTIIESCKMMMSIIYFYFEVRPHRQCPLPSTHFLWKLDKTNPPRMKSSISNSTNLLSCHFISTISVKFLCLMMLMSTILIFFSF